MQFEFATATRILFGAGVRERLPALAAEFGHRALVVTGGNSERAERFIPALEAAGVQSSTFRVPREPTVQIVREGARVARNESLVIGFGGGSAMDAAKAIAAMASIRASRSIIWK